MAWSRKSRQSRGYDRTWEKTRERILERDKRLCLPCLSNGFVTSASQVDHVRPKAEGGTDADDNLQSICDPCHEAKTKAEAARGRGASPRMEREDGWTVR